jgi:hypothetical protein
MFRRVILALGASLALSVVAGGQTSTFTYQGQLTEGGALANGAYDLQFKMFDALTGGNQLPIGSPITATLPGVQVTRGVFTVQLDFSAGIFFSGEDRFLDIAVKHPADSSFTTLSPRQHLTSIPYATRSGSANAADVATVAIVSNDATQLGGVPANLFVVTTDPRMSDARSPLSGSDNYIQNSTNQQPANFNVGGDGVVGGNLGIGAVSPGSRLNITGNGIVRARINSDSNGGLSFALSNQPRWSVATVIGGDLQIFNDANSQLAMSINGNTNVISGNGSGLTNVTAHTTTNYSLLALLRWDLLGSRTFSTGTGPRGVAFDGANLWISNFGSNSVTKLRASDGFNLGTFAVGTQPVGVAFDGANIWVANFSSNNVTKLRAVDGALQGAFPAGTGPLGLAFDGANIWVANQNSNNVTKLRASDGANLGTSPVGSGPFPIAFDGANIWVVNQLSNNVTKLRASDGAVLGTFSTGGTPEGIAFDGANVWVSIQNIDTVTRLRASDGACIAPCNFSTGSIPREIAFDGANIWIANFGSNNVTKLRASDGALQGTFPVGTGPYVVRFDGANVWVANSGSNDVTKIPVR